MKKLLLACTIVVSAGPLHGMEIQQKQVAPITLSQTYHHFTEILNRDVAQEIFEKLFKVQGIDFEPLDINDYSHTEKYLTKLFNVYGDYSAVEIVNAFLHQTKKSICDFKDSYNRTFLHKAVMRSTTNIIKLLIKVTDDIRMLLSTKTTDKHENTALHLAVQFGEADTVKLLLEAAGDELKALLECANKFGHTPLFLAKRNMDLLSPMSPEGLIIMTHHHHPAILKLITDAYAACHKVKDEEEASASCILQ